MRWAAMELHICRSRWQLHKILCPGFKLFWDRHVLTTLSWSKRLLLLHVRGNRSHVLGLLNSAVAVKTEHDGQAAVLEGRRRSDVICAVDCVARYRRRLNLRV